MKQENPSFRIGILGGMGPMAGVFLQQLIIEATPAEKDQDHIQMVCFTNPKIPDRTTSLKEDGGKAFVDAVVESMNVLQKTGVDLAVMACNTAYTRFPDIQKSASVPMLNLFEITYTHLKKKYGKPVAIGILATDGLIQSGYCQAMFTESGYSCIVPDDEHQKNVMKAIYTIKQGTNDVVHSYLKEAVDHLKMRGAKVVLLACTELSLYFDQLQGQGVIIEDPMRICATYLVSLSKSRTLRQMSYVH